MGKKIALGLGLFLLAFFLMANTAVAALSKATVEISPKKTGVPVQFVLGFNVGSAGALEGGRDEIVITFPEDTVFPASLGDNASKDSILVNGFSVNSRSLYLEDTRLIIVLPAELDIRDNSYVGIIIAPSAGIELPRRAGSHYLEIETSRERSLRTNTFTLEGSKVSQLAITATPTSADQFAEFEFSFQTSFRGALTPENDEIYLAFDRALYLPRYISGADIVINGVPALSEGIKVNSETNTLQITVPTETSIENNDNVVVKISSDAGIRNPRQTGTYRVRVYTSADTVNVWEDYSVGLAIAAPFVFLSPDTVGEPSQYTIGFMTSKQGALQAVKDYIYLDFPSETSLPSNILTKYVLINGQNVHATDVSTRNNSVRLTVPHGVRILGDTYVNIVFSNGAGIRNPSTVGNYQIAVSTSADNNEVKSKDYTIAKATASSSPQVVKPDIFLSSYQPQETTTMQVSFLEGTLGNLRGGDKINLIFPVAYEVTGSIYPQHVTVNGREAEKLELVGQTLAITLPEGLDLTAEEVTEVKVSSAVGIKNPEKEGSYSFLLCSSIKYDKLFDYTVKISRAVSAGERPTVELSGKGRGESASYLIFFVNNDTAALRKGDTISLSFPTGTLVPEDFSRSFVKINGTVPERVRVAGNKVVLVLPEDMQIPAEGSVIIFIEENSGLENPRTDGGYNIVVETSRDYFALSQEYRIGEKVEEEENGEGREEGTIVFKIDSKTAYNGKTRLELDTAPTIIESTTVVPLRALGNALGAETTYEDATKTVKVKYQNKELVFYIDSKLVKVNTDWKASTVPATLINNRVMIPARFVSESFGATVSWDEDSREVLITK